jgi:hypothetical protein
MSQSSGATRAWYDELPRQEFIPSWAGAVQTSKPQPAKGARRRTIKADAEPVKEVVSVVTASSPAMTPAKPAGCEEAVRRSTFMAPSAFDVLRIHKRHVTSPTARHKMHGPTRRPYATRGFR